MGKQIYDKPIWLLFREFADRKREGETFAAKEPVDWFRETYPKIKEGSVKAHLVRLTTNNPTRCHYKATNEDDLFFQLESGRFRKYSPDKDPEPIYATDKSLKPKKPRSSLNRQSIEERVSNLVRNFSHYLWYFGDNIKFSGPSVYFHKKVIEKIRQIEKHEQLFDDNLFFEYIYATLAAWGMHRMGEETAKMADYHEFKESICSNKEQILDLSGFKLQAIPDGKVDSVKTKLVSLFKNLRIMESETKLIGASKAIHHLLPDLVPPIDRQHTLRFFYGNTNITRGEEEIFLELFEKFREIATHLRNEDFKFEGFNTSLPKIIDNAIMGYVMMKLLKKSNRHES
jgi:hypothetical protein